MNNKFYYSTLKAAGYKTIIPFVSSLELDNPEVGKMIENAESQNLNVSQYRLESEKKYYVWSLQKGFIMLKPEKAILNYKFKNPGIELDILNEKRFNLAFSLPYNNPGKIDWENVNSIMRPIFPTDSFWSIKLPF